MLNVETHKQKGESKLRFEYGLRTKKEMGREGQRARGDQTQHAGKEPEVSMPGSRGEEVSLQ